MWVTALLLAGAGLILLIVWTLSPKKHETKPAQSEARFESPEAVVPAVEKAPIPPNGQASSRTQAVKLESPPVPTAEKPAEASRDGGFANGVPLKKMRGLLKWMSGTVRAAPDGGK